MRPFVVWFIVFAAFAVAPAGCFDPDVASGQLRCTDRCPGALTCVAGVCCSVDDVTGKCARGAGADGGTSDSGSTGPVLPPATPLVVGPLRLLATSDASCAHIIPEAGDSGNGDRWCALLRPGAGPELPDLWVANVSEALRRPVRCDGSEVACMRLAGNVWIDAQGSLTRFKGDVLLIHSNPKSLAAPFRGRVSAWRPGWAEPRRLTSDEAVSCGLSGAGTAAFCLDAPVGAAYDLTAGLLTPTPNAPLPKVSRVVPQNAQGGAKAHAQFPTSGELLVYSTGMDLQDSQNIYVTRTEVAADPMQRRLIAEKAAGMVVAADGKKVYYLKGVDPTLAQSVGTLVMADLPAGDNAVELATGVSGLFEARDRAGGDHGLVLWGPSADGKASFRLVRDRATPSAAVSLGTGWLLGVSPLVRFSIVVTDVNPDTKLMSFAVIENSGGTRCDLVTDRQGLFAPTHLFSPDDGQVLWLTSTSPGRLDGWVASTDGCASKTKFADGVWSWTFVRESGLLYLADHNGSAGTLYYRRWNQPPASARVVERQVTGYALLSPPDDTVIVTVAGREGLYSAKLPTGE